MNEAYRQNQIREHVRSIVANLINDEDITIDRLTWNHDYREVSFAYSIKGEPEEEFDD